MSPRPVTRSTSQQAALNQWTRMSEGSWRLISVLAGVMAVLLLVLACFADGAAAASLVRRIMAAIVGSIIVIIYLPIFDLGDAISQGFN